MIYMKFSKDKIVGLNEYKKKQNKIEELKAVLATDREAFIKDLKPPDCYSYECYKVIRQSMYNSVYINDYDVAVLIKEFKDNKKIDEAVRQTASQFADYINLDVYLGNQLSYKRSAVYAEDKIEKTDRINTLHKDVVAYLKAVLQSPERLTEYDFITLLLLVTEANLATISLTKYKMNQIMRDNKGIGIMVYIRNRNKYKGSLFEEFSAIPQINF